MSEIRTPHLVLCGIGVFAVVLALMLATAGDFGRLARCLSGRAVGLALGGGGARGFAHVGVLRALKEAGVAIDLIGGTSMGAVVAALHAMGLDCQAMLRMAHDLFLAEKPYREFTLPMISLIRSRRLDRVVRRTYGDTRIEDLWLSYFCISTDLTAAEMVTHDRGPLWRAVRASSSLPGVFVPVVDEGHLLVDGGVMNNLPGDVMRARCGGRVIVVNVSPEQELSVPWKQFPSPWKLLWDRILRFKRRARVPSILDVLMRTIVASSDHRAEQVKADADLYLHPPVARYGLLEFAAYEEITEAGYQYAKETLEELDKNGTLSALTAP